MTNCVRWSETVAMRFPETESAGPRILKNMLPISALESLVTLVSCIICVKNIWEKRESRNSLVGAWWSYFSRSTLKSHGRKVDLLPFEILSSKWLKVNVIKLIYVYIGMPNSTDNYIWYFSNY